MEAITWVRGCTSTQVGDDSDQEVAPALQLGLRCNLERVHDVRLCSSDLVSDVHMRRRVLSEYHGIGK